MQRRLPPPPDDRRLLKPWAFCLAMALGSRLAVLLVGYLAVVMLGYGAARVPPRVSDNDLLNLPARWDSGWYVGIASGGYRWSPARPPYERIKFFPAYPLALRALAAPIDPARHAVVWLWTGVALSTLLFWVALLFVFRLADTMEGVAVARRAVWITAGYPFAIFFGLPYSESLFLASSTAVFLFYRSEKWIAASAWGVVAGTTRPNGVLLSAALIASRLGSPGPVTRSPAGPMAAILSPMTGLTIVCLYWYVTAGHPLVWTIGQPGGAAPLNPLHVLGGIVTACRGQGLGGCIETRGYQLVNVAATFVPLVLAEPVRRRYGWGFFAFLLLNTAMSLLGIGFNCMGRYTSILFPIFLLLAAWLDGWRFRAWMAMSVLGQAMAAAAFFTWRPVY